MPPIIPNRFLVRVAHPCPYVKDMPDDSDGADHLVDLPEAARLRNFAELDGLTNFADVRLAWNEFGLGVQCAVKGKEQSPAGDADRPRGSDGLTLWVDTRDARASHRASRFCHQFRPSRRHRTPRHQLLRRRLRRWRLSRRLWFRSKSSPDRCDRQTRRPARRDCRRR